MVSYTIRKLADGNCWMSENLKLTLSTSHAYEVANFDGTTTSWTPNEDLSSTDPYNIAISQNTQANIDGNWYYPWYAATAGEGVGGKRGDVSISICPMGWRLPSYSGNPSFYSLTNVYGIGSDSAGLSKIKSLPLSFITTGAYNGGKLSYDASVYGYYWSASSGGVSDVHVLSLTVADKYGIHTYMPRSFGLTTRCVAVP